jgi:hypothetical protein
LISAAETLAEGRAVRWEPPAHKLPSDGDLMMSSIIFNVKIFDDE